MEAFSIFGGDPTMLGKMILDELGISIDPAGYLISQDDRLPIVQGGQRLKYDLDAPEKMYIGEGEILFDPIHNMKMMTYLLGNYMDNNPETIAPPTVIYDIVRDEFKPLHMGAKGVKYTDPKLPAITHNIESIHYKNKCLGISDIILQFANMQSDLSEFDVEEEDEKC